MYSISFDYIFNRVYDVLLWIKYTWLFTLIRTNPETYIEEVKGRDWDGLRDRGWFDSYFAQLHATVPIAGTQHSLWQSILHSFGVKLPDSDSDGIPDVSDSSPYDSHNLTKAQLKERYQEDYNFSDKLRDFFGIGPKDSDGDGVPDSYEIKHGMDPYNPDTDHDGVSDGQELIQGTDPLNPDTDGDLVLDGRDEAPLDPHVSSIGKDTDGDGVSDKMEGFLGTDITKKDTDGDGIPDNMDTYPLDPENVSQYASVDLGKQAEGLHFAIQNPVLGLFTDIMSIVIFVILVVFAYVTMRWFITFLQGLNHYEHHFNHNDHHRSSVRSHTIHDTRSSVTSTSASTHTDTHSPKMPAGIAGLPIGENSAIPSPTFKELADHPKFAVIQGYLSSQSEALWRIGILEADNVLLEVLTEKGYQGDGVGEKLKNASFKTIDLAWDAHKIRNRIAHDGSDFELTEREAKRAFMLYESVLRDLKAIR
jgi:hypothetical protein